MLIVFYDRYTEEQLATKIKDSETRLTTMIQSAIAQLKLELKIGHQELLLSDQNKKNQ